MQEPRRDHDAFEPEPPPELLERDLRSFPALRRSFRRGDAREERRADARRSAGGPLTDDGSPAFGTGGAKRVIWASEQVWPYDVTKEHGPLEGATRIFRWLRRGTYLRKASEARAMARRIRDVQLFYQSVGAGFLEAPEDNVIEAATNGMQDARAEEARELARAKWYEGRAGAQMTRFDTIRGCGERSLSVACKGCSEALCEPVPCTCGVTRVCDECAKERSEKRQRRIAHARVVAMFQAQENGLLAHDRPGGAVGEKMLTLTVPHFDVSEVVEGSEIDGAIKGYGLRTTIGARLAALRLAWPRFMRTVKRALKKTNHVEARSFVYYRFLEWTKGSDGGGHPHFHVYWLSRFMPKELLAEWWARALDQVGCPLPRLCRRCTQDQAALSFGEDAMPCFFGRGNLHAIVDIRALYGLPVQQLRELSKSGDKRAIELAMGKLVEADASGRPKSVEGYAGKWSMANAFTALEGGDELDAKRDVYCSLEGRRIVQGARGFLMPLPRPQCPCCGGDSFVAGMVDPCQKTEAVCAESADCRGPPDE